MLLSPVLGLLGLFRKANLPEMVVAAASGGSELFNAAVFPSLFRCIMNDEMLSGLDGGFWEGETMKRMAYQVLYWEYYINCPSMCSRFCTLTSLARPRHHRLVELLVKCVSCSIGGRGGFVLYPT